MLANSPNKKLTCPGCNLPILCMIRLCMDTNLQWFENLLYQCSSWARWLSLWRMGIAVAMASERATWRMLWMMLLTYWDLSDHSSAIQPHQKVENNVDADMQAKRGRQAQMEQWHHLPSGRWWGATKEEPPCKTGRHYFLFDLFIIYMSICTNTIISI
jgi:hypothetical protein